MSDGKILGGIIMIVISIVFEIIGNEDENYPLILMSAFGFLIGLIILLAGVF